MFSNELSSSKEPLLILDDDLLLLKALESMLNEAYTVYVCETTGDAWEVLYSKAVKVLIVDQNLKEEINGVEFSKLVKDTFPTKQIIMMTGDQSLDTVVNALNSSAIDAFVSKPFNRKEMIKFIEENLDTFNRRKSIVQKTISKIRKGQTLDSDEIGALGNKLDLLGEMVNELFINENWGKDHSSQYTVIGIAISHEGSSLYQKFFTDAFSIHNRDVFLGFIESLNLLSKELFSTSKEGRDLIDEFQLQNVSAYLDYHKDYNFIVFVVGKILNMTEFKKNIHNYFLKLIEIIKNNRGLDKETHDKLDQLVFEMIKE